MRFKVFYYSLIQSQNSNEGLYPLMMATGSTFDALMDGKKPANNVVKKPNNRPRV
jgi:hypothetical protein